MIVRIKGIGLGLVASSKRSILEGNAFNNFFPKSLNTDPMLNNNGTVYNTVEYCAKIVENTANDTKAITKLLLAKSKDKNDFLKNVFDFAFHHFQYEQDKPGVEQVRRPARSWKDRKAGIDCDCFSILCGQILYNAGIPFAFRIVKMYGRNYFQHIYIIVPKIKNATLKDLKQRNNYFVIDPVLDKYDYEAPKITETHDTIMKPKNMNKTLNGFEEPLKLGEEFAGLGMTSPIIPHRAYSYGTKVGQGKSVIHPHYEQNNATGEHYYRAYLACQKRYLQHTRDMMKKHPHKFAHFYNTPVLAGMYDQLLGVWDNDGSREAMLQHLSKIEEQALRPELQGLGHILHGPDDVLFGELIDADFSGDLGRFGDKFRERFEKLKTKNRGVFTKIKNAGHTFRDDIRNLSTKEGRRAAAAKVLHNFLKFNPGTIPIRAGFLAGMKVNIFQIAKRLYWGTFPKEVALKAGVDAEYWERANRAYEKVKKTFYTNLGGDVNILERAIRTGRAAHKNGQSKHLSGFDQLLGNNGLGEAYTAAVIAAAIGALGAVAKIVANNMTKPSGKEATEKGGEREPVVINIPAQNQNNNSTPDSSSTTDENGFTQSN